MALVSEGKGLPEAGEKAAGLGSRPHCAVAVAAPPAQMFVLQHSGRRCHCVDQHRNCGVNMFMKD